MIKRILYIISVMFIISSCTDLDETIYDKIPDSNYPENATQVNLLAVPAYTPLKDFLDDGACWWYAQELTSDEVVPPTREGDWGDGGKWVALFTHTWNNKTPAIENMWPKFYSGVLECNRTLELLEKITESPATRKNIAQVRILRAFYYYLLIDNYGNVPYVTVFTGAPEAPSKTARAVIFDTLVSDIEKYIPYLSTRSSNITVAKGMAFTLLAKLYINSEVYTGIPQWAKAEAACDSVLKLGYSLEADPLAPFLTNNDKSTENIFAIPFDEINYTGFTLHMRTLHYSNKETFNMGVQPWNGFAVTEAHYNTYEDADKRKKGFLVGQQYSYLGNELSDGKYGKLIFDPHIPALVMDKTFSKTEIRMSGARVVKFEVKLGAKQDLSNDFPLFRLADVMLMKTECMIRQGNGGTEADKIINAIRKRAGVANFTNATLDDVLAERGREMFWEGHRRQDLIRFGKFGEARWEKPADDSPDRTIFPIPQKQIDGNPNLAK